MNAVEAEMCASVGSQMPAADLSAEYSNVFFFFFFFLLEAVFWDIGTCVGL